MIVEEVEVKEEKEGEAYGGRREEGRGREGEKWIKT